MLETTPDKPLNNRANTTSASLRQPGERNRSDRLTMPDNAFGHFDDNTREYVIVNPRTPYPWINYLGNDGFYSLISNTAGGYCFYKDARFRRLTRYRYNNVPLDNGGRYFYIKDGSSIWSPGWKPVKGPLDSYECRHGLGYTCFNSRNNGVECSALFFVPLGANVEIQRIRIANTGAEPKSLQLYSLVEWCLWNAEDDMTNFQRNFSTAEVEVEGSAIYHKTEYRERRNHFAFYSVNREIQGFDTDRDTFLGLGNGFDTPQSVLQGDSENSIAHGWSPIASHRLTLDLAPGESQEYIFLLGYIENDTTNKWSGLNVINKERAQTLMAEFDSSEKVEAALAALKTYWQNRLDSLQLSSQDPRLDRMVNTWNPYQCMVTFNLSRSASFFESGIGRGMGFRDSNQDLLGVAHLVPERARERIIDLASTQFEDGSAYHQYQPLTKRGNADIGGNFNDDPLWLILSTVAYIKETGDFELLREPVPFENDAGKAKPLLDHLKASFDHVIDNLGPHGLPLIGRADWNDCLNLNCFSTEPNQSFQTTQNRSGETAESLMIAGFFVYAGKQYLELCRQLNLEHEARRAGEHIKKMTTAVEHHGWDGDWYLRAYDARGCKIGSRENTEGKIFIESQGFCVMAGIGVDNGRAEKALNAVQQYLDTEHGIVLNAPAYSRYYPEYGEISSYPPGYKENGGIFCHSNPWIMIAETVLGRGDRAFEYYRKLAPAYREPLATVHKTEPYVYAQMIAGKEAAKPGEAKNSWLTGTAAWNYHAISEHILGIKPQFDGLLIDPCIPAQWPGFEVIRVFRGATYKIVVENPHSVCKGVVEISIGGQRLSGNCLPVLAPGSQHSVRVIMG